MKEWTYPRTCRRGHVIEGPEGERLRPGRRQCKACLKTSQKKSDAKRYAEHREEAIAHVLAYRNTPKGYEVYKRAGEKYNASAKGIIRRVRAALGEAYRTREALEAED